MNMTLNKIAIPQLRQVTDEVWTGGQPSAEQLQQVQAAGIKAVINLCPNGECGWDEKAVVEAQGLHYATVPVSAACDLSEEAARRFHDLLESAPKPVLIHCASGNRVGALYALKAFYVQKHTPDAAIAVGRAAGLASLEATVRKIIS